MTPPALDRVVKTCLAKDPDERWQTAHDLMRELKWIAEGGSQAGVATPVVARRQSRERLRWIAAAVFLMGLLASLPFTIAHLRQAPADARVADGMKIHGQLFLPSRHEANQRRPAVIFFHGGSRRQTSASVGFVRRRGRHSWCPRLELRDSSLGARL